MPESILEGNQKHDYIFIVSTPYNLLVSLSIILYEYKDSYQNINFHILAYNSPNRMCDFAKAMSELYDTENIKSNCFNKMFEISRNYWDQRLSYTIQYLRSVSNLRKVFIFQYAFPEVLSILRYSEINNIDIEINLVEEGASIYFSFDRYDYSNDPAYISILESLRDLQLEGDNKDLYSLYAHFIANYASILTEKIKNVFCFFPEFVPEGLKNKSIIKLDKSIFLDVLKLSSKAFEKEIDQINKNSAETNTIFCVTPIYYLYRINKINEYKEASLKYLNILSLKLRNMPIIKYHPTDSNRQFLYRTSYDVHHIPLETIIVSIPNIRNIIFTDISTSIYSCKLIRNDLNIYIIKETSYLLRNDILNFIKKIYPDVKVLNSVKDILSLTNIRKVN